MTALIEEIESDLGHATDDLRRAKHKMLKIGHTPETEHMMRKVAAAIRAIEEI